MLHFCPQFPLWHLKGQTRNSFIWSPPTVLYIWLCYCKFTVIVIAIQVFIRQSNLFMGGYLKRKNKPRGQNWLVCGGNSLWPASFPRPYSGIHTWNWERQNWERLSRNDKTRKDKTGNTICWEPILWDSYIHGKN